MKSIITASLAASMTMVVIGCSSDAVLEEPGSRLPDFSLQSHDGNTITNADLLGSRSVIWFYPKAATPG